MLEWGRSIFEEAHVSSVALPLKPLLAMMEQSQAALAGFAGWQHEASRAGERGVCRPPPARPIIRCSTWTSTMPYEVLSLLSLYLDPASLASLQMVCRPLRTAVLQVSGEAWQRHLQRSFKVGGAVVPGSLTAAATAYGDYVEKHLRRAEVERACFHATRGLLELMHSYAGPGQRGVLGLVGDLGWFDTEAMARALSKKRSYALQTIVVQSEEVITDFKRRTRHFKQQQQPSLGSPLTFFPLAAAFDIMTVPLADALPAVLPEVVPGFLGYAVHLIRLRREDEYLRHSLYYTIFKNLMVFDTTANLRQYSQALGREPYACALDYYDQQQAQDDGSGAMAAADDGSSCFPRFAYAAPREYPYRDPATCGALLDAQVAACITSLAHIRYGL